MTNTPTALTPPVIVLGMHRSGTSCLTGSLQQAGLVLGDVHTANPFNKKGNREHPDLMALHEAVLQANGGSWHEPPPQVVWPAACIAQRQAFCDQFRGVPRWGFKDPRALLALDGWLEHFPQAQLVGSIRHPLSVARSLYSRDPHLCSLEQYLQLWAVYNRRLLAVWQEYRFAMVDFDLDDQQYQASLDRLPARLGLEGGDGGAAFFDPALRSHRLQGMEGLPTDIAELYRALKQAAAQ